MEIDMNVDVRKFCVLTVSCLVWLNSDSTKWFRLGIFILYLVYTFLTMKKNVVSLNGNRNLKIKFEFKIRNSI